MTLSGKFTEQIYFWNGIPFSLLGDSRSSDSGEESKSKTPSPEPAGEQVELKSLKRGAYFGEAALLSREPRLASVRASSKTVQLCRLDVKAFERLLGPCQCIMSRNIAKYREERQMHGLE